MSKLNRNIDTSKSGKWVLVVLIVVGFIATTVSSPDDKRVVGTPTNTPQTTEDKDLVSVGRINNPVRDGKFEFIVKSLKCGDKSVGTSEYLTKEAQGQFCLLELTVTNIADVPQTLFSDNQYLYNQSGQKYSSDSLATSYVSDNNIWYSEINPGNSVSGIIVFDIPLEQLPVRAELHDSSYSSGVLVDLN